MQGLGSGSWNKEPGGGVPAAVEREQRTLVREIKVLKRAWGLAAEKDRRQNSMRGTAVSRRGRGGVTGGVLASATPARWVSWDRRSCSMFVRVVKGVG